MLGLFGAVGGFAGLIFSIDSFVGLGLLASLAAATGMSSTRRRPLPQNQVHALAELAHELRSPLSAILGYAEELDPSDATANAECIQAIKRNSRYLGRLFDEAFAAGSAPRTTTETDLHALLEEVTAPVAAAARAKGILFTMPIAQRVPEVVVIDADTVRQVITNLLTNAVAFTDAGEIEVAIDHHEDQLAVQVLDSGRGIPPNALSSIFDPFVRGDARAACAVPGAGLGLNIARRLATAMGGSIDVESTLGEGSTFTFRFPAPRPVITAGLLKNRRIVVADDCPDSRRLFERILASAGAQVTCAATGKDALSCTRAQQPDAIVLDIQMDGLDGLKTASRLRAQGYSGFILGVSGQMNDARWAAGLDAGMDWLLQKPVPRAQLLETLRRRTTAAEPLRRAV